MQNHLATGSIFPSWEPQNTNYRGDSYRYGFNGKENDNEVQGTGNQQDYGFRIYDPRLGKFLSVDPLSRKYPELTPYQFASNRPIRAIDLDGLEAYDGPNNESVFSQSNWQSFVREYASNTVRNQIADKDCADLLIECVALYYKAMGVPLSVYIPAGSGENQLPIVDSNNPKYSNSIGYDATGKPYADKFEWFLEDLKKTVGPNGIKYLAQQISKSQATTGDLLLWPSSLGGYFHTGMIDSDFADPDNSKSVGYIYASGHNFGKNDGRNRFDSPLISTGSFISLDGSIEVFRWNFVAAMPKYTQSECPSYMPTLPTELIPIEINVSPVPLLIIVYEN